MQKLAFFPAGTPQDVIDTYTKAFQDVVARGDFAEISSKRVGKYSVFTGEGAQTALGTATNVPDSAKAYVVNWLKEEYGVELK